MVQTAADQAMYPSPPSVTISRSKGKVIWRDGEAVYERLTGDLGGIEQTVKFYAGMGFCEVSRDEKQIVMSKGSQPPPAPVQAAPPAKSKPQKRIPGGQVAKADAVEMPAKQRGGHNRIPFCRECAVAGQVDVPAFRNGLCKPHWQARQNAYNRKSAAKKNPPASIPAAPSSASSTNASAPIISRRVS